MMTIIQPHSDDALLSLGSLMLMKSYEKKLVITVDAKDDRILEDKELERYFPNLITVNLGMPDLDYFQYIDKYQGVFNQRNCEHFIQSYDVATLKDRLLNTIPPESVVYAPLGAGHPLHYLVYKCLENRAKYFYRDFPHSYKTNKQEMFMEQIHGKRRCVRVDFDVEKINLFEKIYQSQKNLIRCHFERQLVESRVEEELWMKCCRREY